MKKTDLIAFASSFVSFALERLEHDVNEIILFGSVARGDFSKDSDVDLFFDAASENQKLDRDIKAIIAKFYISKICQIWRNKGIANIINVKAGILDKWKLKRSIISDGIVLYGRYKSGIKSQPFILFNFEPIKDITKRNNIIRALYGRQEKKQQTHGLVNKYKGKRLSPTVFIVPVQASQEIIVLLNKEKINYVMIEVWSDQLS